MITETQLLEQRMIDHAEGQRDTLADVNAGLVDDLIATRLNRLPSTPPSGKDEIPAKVAQALFEMRNGRITIGPGASWGIDKGHPFNDVLRSLADRIEAALTESASSVLGTGDRDQKDRTR